MNIRYDCYLWCHQTEFSNMRALWILSFKNHFHQKVIGHSESLALSQKMERKAVMAKSDVMEETVIKDQR